MKNLLFTGLLVLMAWGLQAQSQRDFEKWGDLASDINDHYGAARYYRKALDIDSSQSKLLWKYAEALRGYNDYARAEHYYQQIYRKDRGKLYPEGPFWLATMLKHNGKYKESKKMWKTVSNMHRNDRKSYYYLKAQQEMAACDSAVVFAEQRVNVLFDHLPEPVNSYDAEYSPLLDEKGNLYFASLKGELDKNRQVIGKRYEITLFYAEGQNGNWLEITELDTALNRSGYHTANPAISADGKWMVFTQCNDSMVCNLMGARMTDSGWGEVQTIRGINAADSRNTQASFARARGKEWLFFSSDRPGGYGKLDLYYAEHLGNLRFGDVFNLGPEINSMDNDVSPWYDGESETLYFSSDWHHGMGGLDVFESMGFGLQWSPPRNMRPPFNSPANDLYYRYQPEHETGFVVSNREGSLAEKGETCCNDIYRFRFPVTDTLPVIETLEQLSDYLPVTLYFHNDVPNPRSWDTTTTQNYMDTYLAYRAMLPLYQEEYSAGLKKGERETAIVNMADFFENKVDLGVEHLALFTKLLLRELEKGRKIDLTIKGYASPLARSDYNVNLTQRRIQSLVNYLKAYDMGVFVPYMEGTADNGGRLNFIRIPFGAYRAEKSVSDNLHDTRNSVYSRSASLERKIEILSVERAADDTARAEIHFNTMIQNLGAVQPTDTITHRFHFTNRGELALQIKDIVPSCDCASLRFPSHEIAPGEQSYFEVLFEGVPGTGKNSWSYRVLTNGFPAEVELVITGEVMVE